MSARSNRRRALAVLLAISGCTAAAPAPAASPQIADLDHQPVLGVRTSLKLPGGSLFNGRIIVCRQVVSRPGMEAVEHSCLDDQIDICPMIVSLEADRASACVSAASSNNLELAGFVFHDDNPVASRSKNDWAAGLGQSSATEQPERAS